MQIATVEDDDDEGEKRRVSPEKPARHLRLYRIAAGPKRLIAETEVAAQLLSHVADESADFLVMGSYGQSRFRDMVVGGTTLEILRSMTFPC